MPDPLTTNAEKREIQCIGAEAETQLKSNEMLGAVPMPSEDSRCTAVSLRSGRRCKRYRQARSSVCSKHASKGSSVLAKHAVTLVQTDRLDSGIDRVGSGKRSAEQDTDTWAWTEDQWQARFDAVNDCHAAPIPTPLSPTLAVMTAIRDDPNAHDSDRIRAAQAIIAAEREASAAQGAGPSPLVALRAVLDTLRPEERLAWLQSERLAHLSGQEQGASGGAATG